MQTCNNGHILLVFESYLSCPACVYRFSRDNFEARCRDLEVNISDLKKELTDINVYSKTKTKRLKNGKRIQGR